MPNRRRSVQLEGSLAFASRAGSLGGGQRIDLLEQIGITGSISQAAKAVGLSYKGAWDAVETMNNLADKPLVETSTGGKRGGGTRLTARGEQLVRSYRAAQDEHAVFVASLNRRLQDQQGDLQMLGRLMMRTSARNQLWGRVTRVSSGAINDEVELQIKGGDRIVAIVTHESTEHLGLAVGVEAVALIKSSWVMLAVAEDGAAMKLSARNQLVGRIRALTPGAVNTEVNIDLAGGNTLAAIITQASSASMGLKPGMPVTTLFKASSVILGVAG